MGPSTLQGGECEEESVRFGLEVLYVDSWARRRIYAAFKDVLGSGLHHHLQVGRQAGRRGGGTWLGYLGPVSAHCPFHPQNNELLRDIFGLGPVLVLDATALKACKISRFEKVCALGPLTLPSAPVAKRPRAVQGLEEKPWASPCLAHQVLTLCPHSSTYTTRLPSKPEPRHAAVCGTSGQTSSEAGPTEEETVHTCACVFNRRHCNNWSLPGIVALFF